MVAKIGQEQGLDIVFDSQVAPYGKIDITDAVLKELNK